MPEKIKYLIFDKTPEKSELYGAFEWVTPELLQLLNTNPELRLLIKQVYQKLIMNRYQWDDLDFRRVFEYGYIGRRLDDAV